MSCKFVFVFCFAIAAFASLEAASLRAASEKLSNTKEMFNKLDYEGVESNARRSRQAYSESDSGEDSDEDDDEDDAEIQHENAIRRQQAYEQSVDDSEENSDEDDDNNDASEIEDDDSYGRRLRRDVSETVAAVAVLPTDAPAVVPNSIEENTEDKPKPSSPTATSTNTYVLTLIRDTIKKVTELPNTQAVATSAQQYFQLFEHFLQQTIEQVIGDDDDEEEPDSTTIIPEAEKEVEKESEKEPLKETVTQSSVQVNEPGFKVPENESKDKENHKVEPEKKPEAENEIKS